MTIIIVVNRWLFEKYDGVRGFWNPHKKTMYSRKGNRINLPKEIVDTMPSDTFLDGELWYTILQTNFLSTKKKKRNN